MLELDWTQIYVTQERMTADQLKKMRHDPSCPNPKLYKIHIGDNDFAKAYDTLYNKIFMLNTQFKIRKANSEIFLQCSVDTSWEAAETFMKNRVVMFSVRNFVSTAKRAAENEIASIPPANKKNTRTKTLAKLKKVKLVEKDGLLFIAETNANDYARAVSLLVKTIEASALLKGKNVNGEFVIYKISNDPRPVGDILEAIAGVQLNIHNHPLRTNITETRSTSFDSFLEPVDLMAEVPEQNSDLSENQTTDTGLDVLPILTFDPSQPETAWLLPDDIPVFTGLAAPDIDSTVVTAQAPLSPSDAASKETVTHHQEQPISFLFERPNEKMEYTAEPNQTTANQNNPSAFWEHTGNTSRKTTPDFKKILPPDFKNTQPLKGTHAVNIKFAPTLDEKYFFYYAHKSDHDLMTTRDRFNLQATQKGYQGIIEFKCDLIHNIIYIDAAGYNLWQQNISHQPTLRLT